MAKSNENEQPNDGEQDDPAIVPVSDFESDDGAHFHRVAPGEDWEQIADAHAVALDALLAANADAPHFSERSVYVGATVRIP